MINNKRFYTGERVFDKECSEYGTVLQYASRSSVIVRYDQDYGGEPNTCAVDVEHLEVI